MDAIQHAHAAENLLPFLKPGARVLDVGSGSGYLTAIFHHLITENGSHGKVVGIEHITELVEWSQANLRQDGLGEAIDQGHIMVVDGDGRKGVIYNHLNFAILRVIYQVWLVKVHHGIICDIGRALPSPDRSLQCDSRWRRCADNA